MPSILNKLGSGLMRCYPFPRGQGRIVDSTPLGRAKFQEETILVDCVDGFQIEVMPNDHIGRHLYFTGQFDRTIVEVLQSLCRGQDRILDIGANIGYVSCALLHLNPDARVVSVEPQPRVFRLLSGNLARVAGDRGRAIQAAVSNRAGTGTMSIASGNTGASKVVDAGAAGEVKDALTVPLITGKQLFEMTGFERLDLIKIDVENHEETVFESLADVLSQQKPRAIVFEHSGDLTSPAARIRRILDPLGYQLFGIQKSLMKWALRPLNSLAAEGRHAHDYVAVLDGNIGGTDSHNTSVNRSQSVR